MPAKIRRIKCDLKHLKSSKIVIAIAQLEGPLPNGKHKSLVGNRNAWVWKSLEDTNARIEKATQILDELSRLPQKPDLIVFPEYSLPVEKALNRLQEKANQYQQIIIGGADSILQADSNTIHNMCPILLPGRRRPLWVTKRELSKLEQGLVDEPERVRVPVLTWQADGRTYWLSVYICLDFSLAKNETREGGGLFIVPMCSSDVHSFRGWANDALRLKNGTATILCNCVGTGGGGQSGVVAVVPDGQPFKSAFDLPESKEAVAVFEIDCKRLAPPKKTTPGVGFPLGRQYFFSLLSVAGRFTFSRLKVKEKEVLTRGVINPAIFEYLGKKMRMAFLSIDNFWEVVDKLKDQDFEVLAILGQHDLLITHLHEMRYDMIYDIRQVANWRTTVDSSVRTADEISGDDYDNFPFFRVDVYFKALGVEVQEKDRSVFKSHRVPTLEERVQIMKLGNDWNDEQVPQQARESFLNNGWILKTTDIRPGDISFIMSISLEHVGPELAIRQTTFETKVMPEIARKKIVTSIYRGRPQSLAMNYVLRIWSNLDALYKLIEDIHKLASEARVAVNTTTYVVLKKLSDLSLEKAVLAPMLTAEDTNYRNARIAPKLSNSDRNQLVFSPENVQRLFIRRYQCIREAITELGERGWLHTKLDEFERKLAKGLLLEDLALLREPHDLLQTRVETLLKNFVEKEVTDRFLDAWRTSLNIPSHKKKNDLSFTDRIKLTIRYIKESAPNSERLETLSDLMERTPRIRNAFAHGDWEKVTVDAFTEVLAIYCKFLSQWDHID